MASCTSMFSVCTLNDTHVKKCLVTGDPVVFRQYRLDELVGGALVINMVSSADSPYFTCKPNLYTL